MKNIQQIFICYTLDMIENKNITIILETNYILN